MSREIKMSLEEIFEEIGCMLKLNDIVNFCNNQEIMQKLCLLYKEKDCDFDKIKKFLLNNQEHFKKDNLILLIIKNYIDSLKKVNQELASIKKRFSTTLNVEMNDVQEIVNLKQKEKIQREKLENAIRLAKKYGIDSVITSYYYDSYERECKVDVIDSKEIIEGKRRSNVKNKKRIDEIDNYFKESSEDKNIGFEYVMQAILLTDLGKVFPITEYEDGTVDEKFGSDMRTLILENNVIKNGRMTYEELNDIKASGDLDKYDNVTGNVPFTILLPQVKSTLREYSAYLEIDKLLLISAYRLEAGIENKLIDTKLYGSFKSLLMGIYEHINDEKISINPSELEKKQDEKEYEEERTTYTKSDLKKCLEKFIDNTYINEKEINNYRQMVISEEISLYDLPKGSIPVIFDKDEFRDIVCMNDENLKYFIEESGLEKELILAAIKEKGSCGNKLLAEMLEEQRMTKEDLILLYLDNIITLEQLQELEYDETLKLEECVNIDKLDEYRKSINKKDVTQEELEEYNRYLEVYRNTYIYNKDEEELKRNSDKAIEYVIENRNEKDLNQYIRDLEGYYALGIITLDSILEWNDEKIIQRFDKDGFITIADLEELVFNKKNMSFEYLHQKYLGVLRDENSTSAEKLRILLTACIDKNEIQELFLQNHITREEVNVLVEENIINSDDRKDIINSDINAIEQNADTILVVPAGLEKIEVENNRYLTNDTNHGSRKIQEIIDPKARREFFKLLGLTKMVAKNLSEDSPFYNYEFYMLFDADGNKKYNTPVVAERFYEDKDTEEKFATENATYFFQYKDFSELNNYIRKGETAQDNENVVFRANHTLADAEKDGHWAMSVLYSLVKTTLSSDLSEYTDKEKREIVVDKLIDIYGRERFRKILEYGGRIDNGEFNCEIIEETKYPNIEDDNETR